MKYTQEVNQEDIEVFLREEDGRDFCSFTVDCDKEITDASLQDQEGNELFVDHSLSSAEEVKSLVADWIDRLKIFEKEALKYVKSEKPKPKAKAKPKKKK